MSLRVICTRTGPVNQIKCIFSSVSWEESYLICLTSSLTCCVKEKLFRGTFFMATVLPPLIKAVGWHAGGKKEFNTMQRQQM